MHSAVELKTSVAGRHKPNDLLRKTTIIVLGPSLDAVSGVSTHVRLLLNSDLQEQFNMLHFQVGSEGRSESRFAKLFRIIWSPSQLAMMILQCKARIVHINTSIEPKSFWRDLTYLATAKLLSRSIVYQIHGGALPEEFANSSKLASAAFKWTVANVDTVVVLTTVEQKAYADSFSGLQVKLVPNAISVEQWERTRWAKENQPLRLVYIGRLIETKGIKETLDAIYILAGKGRRLIFYIAGSGPYEKAIKLRVQELGLSNDVRLLGPVFGKAKDELWRSSDVFMFPTYHKEGLPYALLEAMAYGVVPVTTRVAAMPDVMTNGEQGLFVPERDPLSVASAIAQLDDDRNLLGKMGAAAQRVIWQRYTVQRLAMDFAKVYKEVS